MKKILVIEDNSDVRENIAEILELAGYEVQTAADGKRGVEIAVAQQPDLIVCDIMMPELDGYGVLHLLNKRKETYGIPFIFLTAKSEKADLRKGMEMGADDYLTKPFDGIELLSAVEVRLRRADAVKKNAVTGTGAAQVNSFIQRAAHTANIALTSNEREVRDYQSKQTIYAEGQHPKALYYVISGKIKIYKIHADGKELITAIYGAGDFFGYTYILEGINYKEHAEILEDAELMLIPKDDFLSLVYTDAQVAKRFIKLMAQTSIEKEEDLLNLTYHSLRKKVAYQLVKLLNKFQQEGSAPKPIKLTRQNLAQATGIATESLIRTLSDFKQEGLIDIQDGIILIRNEDKLRQLPY